MKKILVLAAAGICVVFTSCLKSSSESAGCKEVSPQSEETVMINFCNSHGISYQKDANGILYQIINPGSSTKPTLTNKLFITYKGTLLNDTQFDAQADASKTGWSLSPDPSIGWPGLISGWQIAIPYIGKGGTIKMVIPSSLAYSCIGNGSIPPNSPVYFEVTLVDVQ